MNIADTRKLRELRQRCEFQADALRIYGNFFLWFDKEVEDYLERAKREGWQPSALIERINDRAMSDRVRITCLIKAKDMPPNQEKLPQTNSIRGENNNKCPISDKL